MSPATIGLTVPGISCGNCKADIEGDLASEPGTGQVAVDVATRRVRTAYDQDQTGPEQFAGQARRDRLPGRALRGRPIPATRTG